MIQFTVGQKVVTPSKITGRVTSITPRPDHRDGDEYVVELDSPLGTKSGLKSSLTIGQVYLVRAEHNWSESFFSQLASAHSQTYPS
jgi:hypothetical protein